MVRQRTHRDRGHSFHYKIIEDMGRGIIYAQVKDMIHLTPPKNATA
jgi:hypothetical protein